MKEYLKQIRKSNITTRAIQNKHLFPDIVNVKLIKSKGHTPACVETYLFVNITAITNSLKQQTREKQNLISCFKIVNFLKVSM